jgi:arginase family enzyme
MTGDLVVNPLTGLTILENIVDDSPGQESAGSGAALARGIERSINKIQSTSLTVGVAPPLYTLSEDQGLAHEKFAECLAAQIPRLASRLEAACSDAWKQGTRVVSVGGNHISAIELLGYLRFCQSHNLEPIIIWYDAHLDCNTPQTSLSGNIHGMVAALLFGEGPGAFQELFSGVKLPRPENVIFVGANSEDLAEITLIREKGAHYIPAREYCGGAAVREYLKRQIAQYPRSAVWLELARIFHETASRERREW